MQKSSRPLLNNKSLDKISDKFSGQKKPIILEWDKLSYGERCCFAEMVVRFNQDYLRNVLAKQNKDEIEDWIKNMLYFGLERMSKGKFQFDFTPIDVNWTED